MRIIHMLAILATEAIGVPGVEQEEQFIGQEEQLEVGVETEQRMEVGEKKGPRGERLTPELQAVLSSFRNSPQGTICDVIGVKAAEGPGIRATVEIGVPVQKVVTTLGIEASAPEIVAADRNYGITLLRPITKKKLLVGQYYRRGEYPAEEYDFIGQLKHNPSICGLYPRNPHDHRGVLEYLKAHHKGSFEEIVFTSPPGQGKEWYAGFSELLQEDGCAVEEFCLYLAPDSAELQLTKTPAGPVTGNEAHKDSQNPAQPVDAVSSLEKELLDLLGRAFPFSKLCPATETYRVSRGDFAALASFMAPYKEKDPFSGISDGYMWHSKHKEGNPELDESIIEIQEELSEEIKGVITKILASCAKTFSEDHPGFVWENILRKDRPEGGVLGWANVSIKYSGEADDGQSAFQVTGSRMLRKQRVVEDN